MALTRPLGESVVVVTGASSGIGAATAIELADRGAAVVLCARGQDALDEIADRCTDGGGTALPVAADVTDPAALRAVARRAVTEYGHLDAWVNNAAVAGYALLPDTSAEELRRVIEVDLLGVAYGCLAALPHLRANGGGVIVNNASVLAEVTLPYLAGYNAAKHGVRGLSDTLRQDLRITGDPVDVCTVLPATIDTPFFRHAANHTGRALRPPPPVYPAELVARTIVGLLDRPRREVYAGAAARLLGWQWRMAPGLTERLLTWYGTRTQFRPGEAAGPTTGTVFSPADDRPRVDGGWHGARRHRLRATAGVATLAALGGVAVAVARRRTA